jgi:hypothetical protein
MFLMELGGMAMLYVLKISVGRSMGDGLKSMVTVIINEPLSNFVRFFHFGCIGPERLRFMHLGFSD